MEVINLLSYLWVFYPSICRKFYTKRSNNKKDKRRAKTPSNRNKLNLKYEKISEYIKLNKFSFQNLENKNFALAKFHFEKCIELAEEIDQFKYL